MVPIERVSVFMISTLENLNIQVLSGIILLFLSTNKNCISTIAKRIEFDSSSCELKIFGSAF